MSDGVAASQSESPESSENRPLHSDERGFDSLPFKLRLVLWPRHQLAIAVTLACFLVGMTIQFACRNQLQQGFIDIDRAPPLVAEFKVDINSAGRGEILALPGVGEKLAQAIIDCREQNGPFDSLDSLQEVSGIGARKVELLQPYLLPIKSERNR